MEELKALGIEVIICGNYTVSEVVAQLDMKYVLLDINEQSILDAVNDAQHIFSLEMEKKRQFDSIATIFDLTQEGIIAINKDRAITSMNKNAERQLGVVKSPANQSITKFLPESLIRQILGGYCVFGEILSINYSSIVLNSVPIIVNEIVTGAVITLQDSKRVQNTEFELRKKAQKKGM